MTYFLIIRNQRQNTLAVNFVMTLGCTLFTGMPIRRYKGVEHPEEAMGRVLYGGVKQLIASATRSCYRTLMRQDAPQRETGTGKKEYSNMEEQIQQLRRQLDERVLERAEADPEWRRLFAEDPPTAVADMPEAQRLREIDPLARATEQQPPEAANIPPTEEYQELNQSLTEKVLDNAASDPLWKQRLLTNPEAAMREANFPEYQRLKEIRQEEAEVRGHVSLTPSGPSHAFYWKCDRSSNTHVYCDNTRYYA
jgi:hypothetical protein